MSFMPWGGDTFADAIFAGWLVHEQVEEEKRKRLAQRMVEDTLDRCGFKIMPVYKATEDRPHEKIVVNEHGEPLTPEDKEKLDRVFKEVQEENRVALQREKDLQRAAKLAEEARKQAAYDATAAPYREERRLRKAAAYAKRQPKGTTQ